jgi:glycosyltransferase involved in cell wall biosynthesis
MAFVSIVIPVYNRADLLPRCLSSVEQQTFADWECLIVDDGSADSSLQVAGSFSARDARFKSLVRTRSRKGAAACRNEGIERAKGEFIIFLDSDDVLSPACLARRVSILSGHSWGDFVVFRTACFINVPGDSRKVWNIEKPEPDLLRFLKLDAPWSTSGPIWRKAALLRIGAFEETLPGWQDWQLHVMALLEGLSYLRSDAVDSFWCIPREDKISGKANSVAHLRPKAEFVVRLLESRASTLVGDPLLRHACVGLLWYLIVQLQEQGYFREALRLWSRLRKNRYISFRMWVEGQAALAMHGKHGGSIAWRFVRRWPESILKSIDRRTMLSVPLDVSSRFPESATDMPELGPPSALRRQAVKSD